jgi:hypothetical protein
LRTDEENLGGLTGFVDQKTAARFERVRAAVMAEPRRFARQGSVVAGWRVYAGRKLGPYFRLAYREGRRQQSIYLGRCAELVRRVRELLAELHGPRRQKLLFARLKAQVRASLRQAKVELERQLAVWGIRLEGFEFRGVRRALGPGLYKGKPLRPPPNARPQAGARRACGGTERGCRSSGGQPAVGGRHGIVASGQWSVARGEAGRMGESGRTEVTGIRTGG